MLREVHGFVASMILVATAAGLTACGGGGTREIVGNPSVPLTLVATANSVNLPEGESRSVSVRLSEPPEASTTVFVRLSNNDDGRFTLESSDPMVFDASNWNDPQAVSVDVAVDPDTVHDWARLEFYLENDAAVARVDLIQEDTRGTPTPTQGVSLTVKDSSGVGASGHPVTAVIPLEYGAFQSTSGFRILNGSGDPTPAQFEVLNRWWARDGSIRHVMAHFQATVPPGGDAQYSFETSGASSAPAKAVSIDESNDKLTVDTGVLKFTVRKNGFNLFDEVWLDTNGDGSYAETEKMVASSAGNGPVFTGRTAGDIQRPGSRSGLRIDVEESGPLRAVIRVSGNTIYNSTTDHTHGFAVRIYAYAGKGTVKVDYQLQNSAKNVRHSWPLYFEDVSLMVKPSLQSPTLRMTTSPGSTYSGTAGSGRYLSQSSLTNASVRNSADNSVLLQDSITAADSSFGWTDVSDSDRGLFVTVRHMAEMWPNGIEVTSGGDVAVRLWPRWSAQFQNGAFSSTGLYWLEDMQHVVKEVLYYFHGPQVSTGDLDDLARRFQYNPIPFVPTSEYARTRVTFDLGGLFPSPDPLDGEDTRSPPKYSTYNKDPQDRYYNFGWTNFGGSPGRKRASTTGGFPATAALVAATGRVDEWIAAERRIWDDLNCRGQSIADYTREDDFSLLQLENIYGTSTWRRQFAEDSSHLDAPYLPGTSFGEWQPRDNQHGWFYAVEEFYYFSGNPWIRDWYEFVKEYRTGERSVEGGRGYHAKDGFESERGEGHTWAALLQAYRILGDPDLLPYFRSRLENSVLPNRDPRYGIWRTNRLSTSQAGYMARSMISLVEEVGESDPQLAALAFNAIWSIIEWNQNLGQFGYYVDSENTALHTEPSATSSGPMGDPHALFALLTGRREYWDLAKTAIESGLNGGSPPYNTFELTEWEGAWTGRVTNWFRENDPAFPPPQTAIADLAAVPSGNQVSLRWTTPSGARKFHVLWSTKPISGAYTTDTSKANAWAANPVGSSLVGRDNVEQSMTLDGLPSGQTLYFAIYCFGTTGAMSDVSNVAALSAP